MKTKILPLFGALAIYFCCLTCPCVATDAKLTTLRCEYLENPLGIDVPQPRLSWIIEANQRGQKQTAYRILVASSAQKLEANTGDLWDSGKCDSDRSIHVAYNGQKLESRTRYFWKVQVWDKDEAPSDWSAPSLFSTGIFRAGGLNGLWIGAGPDSKFEEDPWLRKIFLLADQPTDALAYVASIGYHELFINGKKVGDAVLSPSTSDLTQRARYVTYDITPYLNKGTNTMAFWLGSGWSKFPTFQLENKPLVLAEANVVFPNGDTAMLTTDESWKIHPSSSTLMGDWKPGQFGGEHVDASKHLPNWNIVGFDDSAWATAKAYTPELKLSAEMIEPNRKAAVVEPIGIDEVRPGVYRVDLGLNFAGWTEIALRGEPGKKVALSFSEHANGENKFRIRSACTLDDHGRGVFRNRFNYSAGRYIHITGLNQPPDLADIIGHVVRNDYRSASTFKCSDPLLNQINDTVRWTFESLSLGGYVVDCPHRERLGYGGDAHATMEMALNHYGMGAFFTKWIEDWRDVQKPDGDLPYTAPTYRGGGGPAWSGACVTLPWAVYERYADLRILEETYPTMQRWIAFLDTKASGNMLAKWGGKWDFLGDWVPPGKNQGDHRVDENSTLFFNNCYYLYNVKVVAKISELLGKPEEAKDYREKAEDIRKAVHQAFFHPENNTYANGDQLYMALPLLAGVTPDELRQPVMEALEKEILEAKGGHIDTGIHGTYFLIKILTALDRNDLIFTMTSKTDYPSWGHMLEQGATTIWEQWDGEHSLLHSSFLSIGAWFIEGVAGIQLDPRQPGYKHFTIKPGVVGDLTWAKGELDSIHGKIVSDWKVEGGAFTLSIVVPPNTTATIHVPARKVSIPEGATFQRMENGCAVFTVESGSYRFRSEKWAEQKR